MKELRNKQTITFDTNNHYDMLTIGTPLSLYKILLNIKTKSPAKENTDIILTYKPIDNSDPIVSICKINKGKTGGDFIVGKPDMTIEDIIMLVEVEANVSEKIEIDVEVYKIDIEERMKV